MSTGEFKTTKEVVMLAVPRGKDEFRIVFKEGITPEGKQTAWHEMGLYVKNQSGEWRHGDRWTTIRGKELRPAVAALIEAVAGSLPEDIKPAARVVYTALKR
jgi:hypothetical protein